MLRINFTNKRIFSFDGPNLSFLGNETDFLDLAKSIVDLTAIGVSKNIEIMNMNFVRNEGEEIEIYFSSRSEANLLGTFDNNNRLLFELDPRYWERMFKYFILMSWDKKTYYLNNYEDCLSDLDLEQECNFICSSEF